MWKQRQSKIPMWKRRMLSVAKGRVRGWTGRNIRVHYSSLIWRVQQSCSSSELLKTKEGDKDRERNMHDCDGRLTMSVSLSHKPWNPAFGIRPWCWIFLFQKPARPGMRSGLLATNNPDQCRCDSGPCLHQRTNSRRHMPCE